MQFMSGAMGWADTIILAMAPLGIITAIVAAIRVGGPSWLKAVIGRARENLAVAEAELMSSTSQEVCELWNGREIVRCMGSPSVTEFICLLPRNGNASGGTPEIVQEIVITRNLSLDAPNISVNAHRQTSRGELRIVAAFGTILQLGVLVYSGFATYHPALKFSKDDSPIESYAYPCAAVGTFILVAGMMLCAHVVDSSTEEKRFRPKPETNMRVRMVWLQQTKTVNDQVFGSFAVYAKDDQPFITTSRRPQKAELGQSRPATDDGEYPTPGDASLTIQVKTVIGAMITLIGFVIQFVGLRGLHWSASITQLGAVLVMVFLKAWVRRGLATPPKAISLPPGYELDWFARTLGKVDEAPWNGEALKKDQPVHGRLRAMETHT
ncbi:hypothetical protein LY76DRAFT_617418 [Colletotrichum caudatum]|nr:hypothetical protein LY76DRAFT_617418 [Colletotrichum caudatum]